MGSRGKPLFDLNEPPTEADEESDGGFSFQPEMTCPSTSSQSPGLFSATTGTQRILNNHGFSHASTVSGFQPFIRPKAVHDVGVEQKRAGDQIPNVTSPFKPSNGEAEASPVLVFSSTNAQAVDREEGEWSDAEGVADVDAQKGNDIRNLEGNGKGDLSGDGQEELSVAKHVKGTEASHALKCANNSVKRKIDHHKEAMLGKKRNRQTMFLKLEDVKQAGPIKTSTPRRQNFPAPVTTRITKDVQTNPPPAERVGEKQIQPVVKDVKQDISHIEGSTVMESEPKVECNGDLNSAETCRLPVSRQSSWKLPNDSRLLKKSQLTNRKSPLMGQTNMDPKLGNKKHLPVKKQSVTSTSYQDTSVERLIREVTNEKFWHNPGPSIMDWTPTATCGVHPSVRRACWMENIPVTEN